MYVLCCCGVGLLLLLLCGIAGLSVDDPAVLVIMASSRYFVSSSVGESLFMIVWFSRCPVTTGVARSCHTHRVFAQYSALSSLALDPHLLHLPNPLVSFNTR